MKHYIFSWWNVKYAHVTTWTRRFTITHRRWHFNRTTFKLINYFCYPQEIRDWKYVAMVMDRLFLFIFTTACFSGTLSIFLNAPSLYDHREPLVFDDSQVDNCSYGRWSQYNTDIKVQRTSLAGSTQRTQTILYSKGSGSNCQWAHYYFALIQSILYPSI